MKYVAAYFVTVIVIWNAWHDPKNPALIPVWIEMPSYPLLATVPLSLLAQLCTRRLRWPASRLLDLAILFVLVGGFVALNHGSPAPFLVRSPFRFWLRLTSTVWSTLFLPFVATLAIAEGWTLRSRRVPPSQQNVAASPLG